MHLGDEGVVRQAARELSRGRLRPVEPDGQRAKPAEREERLEVAGDGAVVVAMGGKPVRKARVAADHGAEQEIGVPSDELRGRVQDDVGAQLERSLAQRRGERRIDDRDGAPLAGGPGDSGDVGHHDERVRDRLDPDHVGVDEGGDDRRGVAGRDEVESQATLGMHPFSDVPHAVVGDRRHDQPAARRDQVGDGRGSGQP